MAEEANPVVGLAVKSAVGVIVAAALGGAAYVNQLVPRIDALETHVTVFEPLFSEAAVRAVRLESHDEDISDNVRDIEALNAALAVSMRDATLRDAAMQKLAEEMRLRLQALELAAERR